MINRCLLYLFVLGVPLNLIGQEVRFTASADAKQVIVGSTFSIEFTLENADAEDFNAPDFSPFKVVSGPSQSLRSTFINGVGTKSVGFGYTLQTTRVGAFTIPGATVRVKGKVMRSNPIRLEVLKADDLAQSGVAPQIFIRAEVDSTNVYIGQQVMIRYKIYTQVNIENYNILTESSYAGCFAQALDTYKEPVLKEVMHGQEYSTKVLRKIAVFPQQGGKIDIEPLVVQVGVPSKSSVRRGLLSSFGLERKNINSNTISLNVKSAHDQAPDDFSGAVGIFEVDYSVRPNQVTTDDAISIVMRISGNGDIKTIRSPKLKLPSDFEVFDPKVRDEKMINATDSVRAEKIIEYLVIGHTPGNYLIRPSFTYFDPADRKFKTVADSFPVVISQGSGRSFSNADNLLKEQGDELAPMIEELDLYKVRKPIYKKPWYVASYLVPLLAFVFLSWRSKKVAPEATVDPHAVATARLLKAKEHLDQGAFKLFYEEIAYSLKQFIAFKFGIQPADLSRQKITDSLFSRGIEADLEGQIQQFIDRCDRALYAGQNDSINSEATYHEAIELITRLNEVT